MRRVWTLAAGAALMLFGAAAVSADEFDSAGVTIHYTVQGRGEPVILIHGLCVSAAMNWDLPGITKELAQHFKVIEFDNRGHGESGKPTDENQYGTNMVEDVVRLMDHLHIGKARIVGYSMGGMITVKLLTMHPERVTLAVVGGMGWLRTGNPLTESLEMFGGRRADTVLVACFHGMARLAITEAEVKAIHVPVVIIIGESDPGRRLCVDPLRVVRPDWPVHIIEGAGHIGCVFNKEFKAQLLDALQSSNN